MRYGFKRKYLCCGLVILTFIILLHPDMNGRGSYDFIDTNRILQNLQEETTFNFTSTALSDCDYVDVLNDDTTLSITLVDADLYEGHRIKEGGEYAPNDCKPKYSTAVIVPYRDQAEQLRGFLVYMHMFLRRQKIHYRIYVVEQVDTKPFNRAKLMNIGAMAAVHDGYPCLILHDVDLLPLRPANMYACTKHPRHMSSSINNLRFVLPYLNLFGGVISIASKHFKIVNGMSNKYFGHPGEDDDFFVRLEAHNLGICRFKPETSRYYMSSHNPQIKMAKGNNFISIEGENAENDGINSLKYTEVATVLHPLFTHIMVDL